MPEQFIGQGWNYPLGTDAAGSISLASGNNDLEQAIRLILGTAPGERPMRPEFGCGIHNYVFAPADLNTAGQVAQEVRSAIARWEPRVDVNNVDVAFDSEDSSVLYIDVKYSPRGSYDTRNLVFPFYVIPEEG